MKWVKYEDMRGYWQKDAASFGRTPTKYRVRKTKELQATLAALVEERADLDDEIQRLTAEANKGCPHPKERIERWCWHKTDTLGHTTESGHSYVCRLCNTTLEEKEH